MNAVIPLVRLRTQEIVHTWRLWTLPTMMLVLAVAGPLLARFTNELLTAALGSGQAGTITLPAPTAADAYAQWTKNLTQLVLLVVVVMAAGAINTEVRSGVAALLLVKPPNRTAYVLTHALAIAGFTALTAFLGAGVTWLATGLIFGPADAGPLLGATAAWLVLAAVLIGASLLASATIDAAAGAAGVGVATFFVLAVLGAMPWLAEYTPAGLITATNAIAAGTQAPHHALWWPIVTGLLLAVALLAVTAATFRRREL